MTTDANAPEQEPTDGSDTATKVLDQDEVLDQDKFEFDREKLSDFLTMTHRT